VLVLSGDRNPAGSFRSGRRTDAAVGAAPTRHGCIRCTTITPLMRPSGQVPAESFVLAGNDILALDQSTFEGSGDHMFKTYVMGQRSE
jgi:hypothetical protein